MGVFLQDSGAAFSRLQTEFIEKIIKRSVDILIEEGEIQPVKIDGRAVTIKHTSPLAKVQDQDELAALRTLLESGAAFGPELLAGSVVMEEVLPWIAKKLGVDNDLIRTQQEREAYKQAMAQQVQQQQMMDQHRMQQEVAQAEQPVVQ